MRMNVFILCIFTSIFLPENSISLFRGSHNKMMNKAKTYYKSQLGKDKAWHFLGHDISEYPGTDAKYRKVNKEKWNEYYECLKIQNNNLGGHQSVTPEAMQAFEGSSVKFDCKICLNPNERLKIDTVEWYWAPLNSKHMVSIEYTEHITLSPEDKTLLIYNLQEDQTGQYQCKLGESLTAPYFLTVTNSTMNISEVHTLEAPHGPYPKKSETISLYNLILDTVWGDWSPCNKCKQVGKRYKFGYCTIFITSNKNIIQNRNENNGNSSNTHFNISDTTIKMTTKKFETITTAHLQSIKISTTTKQEEVKRNKKASETDEKVIESLELFKIFISGIPCQSHILPECIKNLTEVKNRMNEVMIGYCKVPCPEAEIFEVRDKKGKIIERANNSAGIYSMLQGMPPVEPPVERRLMYVNLGEHVTISCPGNLNSDTPVRWQIGPRKLIPEIIAEQSKGRIYISVMDKINIKKTKISDSNIYSCWQNNDLAGTVRVVVEKKIKLTFNHHIMLFGMILIVSAFLYVFIKAFLGRKHAVTYD